MIFMKKRISRGELLSLLLNMGSSLSTHEILSIIAEQVGVQPADSSEHLSEVIIAFQFFMIRQAIKRSPYSSEVKEFVTNNFEKSFVDTVDQMGLDAKFVFSIAEEFSSKIEKSIDDVATALLSNTVGQAALANNDYVNTIGDWIEKFNLASDQELSRYKLT